MVYRSHIQKRAQFTPSTTLDAFETFFLFLGKFSESWKMILWGEKSLSHAMLKIKRSREGNKQPDWSFINSDCLKNSSSKRHRQFTSQTFDIIRNVASQAPVTDCKKAIKIPDRNEIQSIKVKRRSFFRFSIPWPNNRPFNRDDESDNWRVWWTLSSIWQANGVAWNLIFFTFCNLKLAVFFRSVATGSGWWCCRLRISRK